ncbi:MAG: 2-hydroxyacid dehydrogenase [Bradymonadia bacterium]
MRVYATCDLGPALSQIRDAGYTLEVHPSPEPPERSVIEAQLRSGVAGLITTLRDPIDAQMLQVGVPHLKVVAQCAVGLDNIDVDAAHRLGITVTHTPGVLTGATAEFALFALGALARRLRASEALVRDGAWSSWHPSQPFLGREVAGMTIGVVGLGRIGRAFAARCAALDVDLLLCDPRHEDPTFLAALQLVMDTLASTGAQRPRTARYGTLDTVLAESDALSLHVPLTDETRHLIDASALARLKPSALLVNTARGAVVDEEALAQVLRGGHLGGVALDVFETEPLPQHSPLLHPELADRVRVFHHFGSGTEETRLSPQADVGMAGRCVAGLLWALGQGQGPKPDYVLSP